MRAKKLIVTTLIAAMAIGTYCVAIPQTVHAKSTPSAPKISVKALYVRKTNEYTCGKMVRYSVTAKNTNKYAVDMYIATGPNKLGIGYADWGTLMKCTVKANGKITKYFNMPAFNPGKKTCVGYVGVDCVKKGYKYKKAIASKMIYKKITSSATLKKIKIVNA